MQRKNDMAGYDEIRGRESEDYIEEYVSIMPKFSESIDEYEYDDIED